jgi:hypothetical protein
VDPSVETVPVIPELLLTFEAAEAFAAPLVFELLPHPTNIVIDIAIAQKIPTAFFMIFSF